jgi:hypothetical protein
VRGRVSPALARRFGVRLHALVNLPATSLRASRRSRTHARPITHRTNAWLPLSPSPLAAWQRRQRAQLPAKAEAGELVAAQFGRPTRRKLGRGGLGRVWEHDAKRWRLLVIQGLVGPGLQQGWRPQGKCRDRLQPASQHTRSLARKQATQERAIRHSRRRLDLSLRCQSLLQLLQLARGPWAARITQCGRSSRCGVWVQWLRTGTVLQWWRLGEGWRAFGV